MSRLEISSWFCLFLFNSHSSRSRWHFDWTIDYSSKRSDVDLIEYWKERIQSAELSRLVQKTFFDRDGRFDRKGKCDGIFCINHSSSRSFDRTIASRISLRGRRVAGRLAFSLPSMPKENKADSAASRFYSSHGLELVVTKGRRDQDTGKKNVDSIFFPSSCQ